MNTEIDIVICHGSMNKFVLIDEIKTPLEISEVTRAILSEELCSMNMFNANGVLFVQASKNEVCLCKMRMFNADGTEAEMCGNGIRCVGRYASEYYGIKEFVVETKLGTVNIKQENNIYGNIATYNALINPVNLNVESLPMRVSKEQFIDMSIEGLLNDQDKFTAISVQNPHIVFIRKDIDKDQLYNFGEVINKRVDIFPNQVNINFVKVFNKDTIYVVTNERGSGITPSCGTGMSSSTYVSCLLGHTSFKSPINVYNDGGKVVCIADNEKKSIQLIGNASYISKYKVEFNMSGKIVNKILIYEYKTEISEYQEFMSLQQKQIEQLSY